MTRWFKEYWILIGVFIVPFFFKKEIIISIINEFWIDPIVSKINYEHEIVGFCLIVILILTIYNLGSKLKNLVIIGFLMASSWTLIFTFLYKFNWKVSPFLINFILAITTGIVYEPFIKIFFKKSKQKRREDKIIDDEFKREPFALKIAEKIREQESNESYNIAIVGAWGSGKSYFINLIKAKFENDKDVILEYFIPAEFKSGHDIIIPLLKKLDTNKTDNIFHGKINDLIHLLQQDSDNYLFKIISYIYLIFNKEKTIHDVKNEISKILIDQNKRVIIFIDDFDRLEKDEILEVFRILRNTLNIANFHFIIGFDREYVASKLEINRFDEYTEKFFQIRVDLPIIENFEIEKIFSIELMNRLNLRKDYCDSLITILKQSVFIKMIKNRRDAINICENLSLVKKAIGENCDLRILMCLEILRYKQPELYNYLATNMDSVLEEFKNIDDD